MIGKIRENALRYMLIKIIPNGKPICKVTMRYLGEVIRELDKHKTRAQDLRQIVKNLKL